MTALIGRLRARAGGDRRRGGAAPAPPAQVGLAPRQTLVLYDGGCGICQDFVRLGRRLDRRERLAFLPQQAPGLLALLGLSQQEAARAAWAVLPDGRLLEGAAAMAAVIDACAPWPWPIARRLQGLPLVRGLSDRAYRHLAANRHRLGRGACALPSAPPELDETQRAELARRRARADWTGRTV